MIRDERQEDVAAVGALVTRAFAGSLHGDNDEAGVVAALRAGGALAVSMVDERDRRIVGYAAFSPVSVGDGTSQWFGLGPVAVEPGEQGKGIGAALIEAGLSRLRAQGAAGCVVLGNPAYYGRFGFRCARSLRYPQAPAEYFQALSFTDDMPAGEVAYHAAFG